MFWYDALQLVCHSALVESAAVVTQVRAVVANAMEALVPHVAAKGKTERQGLDAEYARVFRVNLALSSLGSGLLAVNAPLLGLFWVGRYEPTFLSFTAMLALAWWINTLCVPAYYLAQGLGLQRWPVLNHVVMAALAGALGAPLGAHYGGMGVLGALIFAMIVSTLLVLVGVGRALSEVTGSPVRVRIPVLYGLLALGLCLPGFCTDAGWSLIALACLGALGSLWVTGLLWRANRDFLPGVGRVRREGAGGAFT